MEMFPEPSAGFSPFPTPVQPVQSRLRNIPVHLHSEGESRLRFMLLSHVANAFEMFLSLLSQNSVLY